MIASAEMANTKVRDSSSCKRLRRSVQYRSWVPFLAIASHLVLSVDAFSFSATKRLNFVPNVDTTTTSYYYDPRLHSGVKLMGRSHRGVPSVYQQRTRNRTHKFFLAYATGRALNNAAGSENVLSRSDTSKQDEEEGKGEYPWDCIIDPTCCDKCLDHYQLSQQYDFGWWLKNEASDDTFTVVDKVAMTVTAVAGILSFALLLHLSGPGAWRFFLAGGLCAALSHAIPTPIDVIKVRDVSVCSARHNLWCVCRENVFLVFLNHAH